MASKSKRGKNTKKGGQKKSGVSNKKHSYSFLFIGLIVLTALVVLAVVYLSFDSNSNEDSSVKIADVDSLKVLSDSCLNYAKNSLRNDFCKYYLVNDELINCRDSRIIPYLESRGVDVTLSYLNCRNIDNYSFRKTACELLAPEKPDTKIADSTCGYYK